MFYRPFSKASRVFPDVADGAHGGRKLFFLCSRMFGGKYDLAKSMLRCFSHEK
jgi:hypothetical protein